MKLFKSFGLTVGFFAAWIAALLVIVYFPITVPIAAIVVLFCLVWKGIYDNIR